MPKKRPYGLPYQGSKAAIARWVADIILREGVINDYYEPFAGGCAVAHCLLDRSAIRGRCVLNDLCGLPGVFVKAYNGEIPEKYLKTFITRERWWAEKEADAWVKFAGSFACKGTSYMYGRPVEKYREAAFYALVDDRWDEFNTLCPEVGEACKDALTGINDVTARRIEMARVMTEILTKLAGNNWSADVIQSNPLYKTVLKKDRHGSGACDKSKSPDTQIYYIERLTGINGNNGGEKQLERVERLTGINGNHGIESYAERVERLGFSGRFRVEQLERNERLTGIKAPIRTPVESVRGDYRSLEIPSGAVVYCDPPYNSTTGYTEAGGFNFDEFIDWACKLATRCRVYVSEYNIPDDRFEIIGERTRQSNGGGVGSYRGAVTERLYRVHGGAL